MKSDWPYVKFKDVCEHSAFGPRFSSDEYAVAGNVACLRTMDIDSHGRINYEAMPLAELDLDRLRNHILQKGDLVITRTGAYLGKVGLFNEFRLPVLAGAFSIRFRLKPDKADALFLQLYFNGPDGQIGMQSIAAGSAQPNLNIPRLHSLSIPCPPLPEQQAIATLLSSLDKKIDLLQRQNKTLEALAETLFRQWFVGNANELVPITHYVDFNPIRRLQKETVAPYLDMAGVSTSTFNPTGWYDRAFTSGTKFQNGDTLIARITPCLENGKSAFVTFLLEDQVAWGSTEFIVMRSKETLSPFFSYALARNQDFRDYAEGCMAGSSGRQRVDVDHLKQFELGLVSNDSMGEFNRLVEAIPPKLHQNMLQINTLERLRDTLLPKLMSGEVRVAYDG